MKKLAAIFISALCFCSAYAQAPALQNTKVKSDYVWGKPTGSDMCFYLHSSDQKPRTFYVSINDMYVPINAATGYSLGTYYAVPKNPKLVLFSRAIVDGRESFTPQITINTENFYDFAVGIFEYEKKLNYKLIDISLDAMPIDSATIVNMQPVALGVTANKKSGQLGFLKKITETSKSMDGNNKSYIEVYSLKNPKKPELLWPGNFRYRSGERIILFVMGSKIKKSDLPDESDNQLLVISNKGPRN